MKNTQKLLSLVSCLLLLTATALGKTDPTKPAASKPTEKPVTIVIETSISTTPIEIELNKDKAPESVANFLRYVDKKFYDNLVFHRVIDNFMIQGGGFDKDMKQKDADAAIKNEANNGLKNKKGTIAMARTMDVNSASSQFYINLKDNDFLDYKGPMPQDYGYAVFGQVTKGLDVVETIGKTKTATSGHMGDVPVTPIIIKSIRKKAEGKS